MQYTAEEVKRYLKNYHIYSGKVACRTANEHDMLSIERLRLAIDNLQYSEYDLIKEYCSKNNIAKKINRVIEKLAQIMSDEEQTDNHSATDMNIKYTESQIRKYLKYLKRENDRNRRNNEVIDDEYLKDKNLFNGIGMYIWGDAGTGKTHALYTLANELAYSREYGVYFTSILDILNGMKKNFTDTEEQENIKERAKEARFLFLDDIGAEQLKDNSDWYKSIIYEIIDYRYRKNRPTVFSSNYSKTELVNKRHYDERLV